MRGTLHAVIGKRDQLYQAITEAVSKTYEAKLAYAYESATTKTALVDATFDFSQATAKSAFARIVASGAWDDLFLTPIAGVTLARGELTHGLSRTTSVQLTLPTVSSVYSDVVSSLAKLEVHTEGTELVGTYSLNASDEVRSVGRYQSRLALTAAYSAQARADSRLRVHGEVKSTWTYQYRLARAGAKFAELSFVLAPIHTAYFPEKFAAPASSFDTWLLNFDTEVEKILHNGVNNFGDVLLGLEIRLAGDLLAAWSVPRAPGQQLVAACDVSRAIQRRLRQLLVDSYTQDLAHLEGREALYALIVYASLPVVNWVDLDDDTVQPSGRAPYWNWRDYDLAGAMVFNDPTRARLTALMERIRQRLVASGQLAEAKNFAHDAVDVVLRSAYPGDADRYRNTSLLASLLLVEAEIIRVTTDAIRDLAQFTNAAGSDPAAALAALASFGADLTTAFNGKLKSIYLPSSVRSIGSLLFCEATQALNVSPAGQEAPGVLLSVTVLRPGATFQLGDFLKGKSPTDLRDVVAQQRLVQNVDDRV